MMPVRFGQHALGNGEDRGDAAGIVIGARTARLAVIVRAQQDDRAAGPGGRDLRQHIPPPEWADQQVQHGMDIGCTIGPERAIQPPPAQLRQQEVGGHLPLLR